MKGINKDLGTLWSKSSGKVAQNRQSECFAATQPHLHLVLDGQPRLVWVNQRGNGE